MLFYMINSVHYLQLRIRICAFAFVLQIVALAVTLTTFSGLYAQT